MFPFTTSLLRLSFLVPLEIARAYAEAFLSTTSISRPPAPKSDRSKGTAGTPLEAMSSGNRVPSDQPTNAAKAMSTQFYDTQVTTVDYQILFTKRNREALLDKGTVIVTNAMGDGGFASWQISIFTQKLNTVGIPKPKDWTEDEAIELAAKVVPTANPAAAAVIAAAGASAGAAKEAAEYPGDLSRALAAWAAADAAKEAADEVKAAAPAALKDALKDALNCAEDSRDHARTYDDDRTNDKYLAAAKAAHKAAAAAVAAAAAAAGDYDHSFKTIIGLKPENLKYLQVDHQIISTFDRKPPRYDADQVDALRKIARVIENKCS